MGDRKNKTNNMAKKTANNLEKLQWHTEQRLVDELVPWSENPRKMDKKQEADLRESIERLNLMSIPVVNINGVIISGHQRAWLLQQLGRGQEMIDVRVPNRELTEEELREANLRENKNLGEWDWGSLMNFDKEELLKVGFNDDELKMGFDLDETAAENVEAEKSEILRIEPPESVQIKEEAKIYFDSKEDYDRVKEAILKDRINAKSLLSLL